MKKCSTCQIEKPFDCFYKWKNGKDGLGNQCKDCKKEYYYRDHEAMKKKLRDRYAANPQKVIDAQREYYSTVEGRKRRILIKAKERAKIAGLEFDLTEDDIVIPTHCPYLGIELTHDLGKGQLKSNSSIDRIDSTKGYVKGNVQIISRQANTMKNDATQEELERFALSVLGLQGKTLEAYANKFRQFM